MFKRLSPVELSERIARGEGPNVVDVREPVEYEIARIEGATLLPLSRFHEWAGGLNPEDELIFMCHHGVRSAQVCAVLARAGFANVWNLEGGIDRWSREVDSAVPLY
jgi:rhodanese-related sulfurtransferase